MARRFKTRWAVAAFLVVGVVVALILLVRDLGDSNDDEPEETGTVSRLAA
jgi:predicted benzoate:H+ symporter BenE